jgi:NAD(P)-dependent dehydrogenase (short-subunit alcohol dehydrogenase family)
MQDFKDRVAVVTGGGSGIGAALVHALAAEGAHVVVADVEGDRSDAVAAKARESGVRAISVPTDVSRLDSVEALAERVSAEFGAIQLLFNNAGVISFGRLQDLSWGDWQWMFGVNVNGVVHGLLAFLPGMLAGNGERHIVNTGSIAGLVPVPRQSAYGATKHAVVGLTESLRVELEPQGIGVSVLCPGAVATDIVDAVRNRPGHYGGRGSGPEDLRERMAKGMAPAEVARKVLKGIRNNELYIVTHPHNRQTVQAQHKQVMAAYDRQAAEDEARERELPG